MEEEQATVQRESAAGPAGGALTAGLAPQVEATRRGGEPLDPDVRAVFEPRFGRDLSSVRTHRDATAADAASTLAPAPTSSAPRSPSPPASTSPAPLPAGGYWRTK